MSRTHKDKPQRVASPEHDWRFGTERIEYTFTNVEGDEFTWYRYLDIAGARTKKKRSHKERNWMTTPMWWIREMMNQPQRVATKQWERQVVRLNVGDLLDEDTPSVSKKPHRYYW